MKQYKVCECFEVFKNKVIEKELEIGREVESVEIINLAFLFSGDCQGTTIAIPVEVKIKKAKSTKKEKINLMAKYCPFCGKPLYEEIE